MSTLDSVPTKPAGSCKHRPISNGWSVHKSRQSDGSMKVVSSGAWCGYCRAFVQIDREWQQKFVDHGRALPPVVAEEAAVA